MKKILVINRSSGFTLVELAMVMLIITLLITGLVPTISSQIEQQRTNETRKMMNDIKEALFGYTIIYGHLPCPTTQTDPANVNYGIAPNPPCPATLIDGYLPWKTLGIPETDAWGSKRTSIGDPWRGYWRYRADLHFSTNFALASNFGVCIPVASANTDCLRIIDNGGNSITTEIERPIAIVFSTGKDLIPNGENADYETILGTYQSDTPKSDFDDMVFWISRPQLFNRMVVAGKLP